MIELWRPVEHYKGHKHAPGRKGKFFYILYVIKWKGMKGFAKGYGGGTNE